MTNSAEQRTKVPDEIVTQWAAAAHTARLARYVLDEVIDPRPGSVLAGDDSGYGWERLSAWTRSYLGAALDHLILWANIVTPQQVFEGMTVQNPPRAYYTLARAALESSAQAVWVLEASESEERILRHLRLVYHDLRQMAIALEKQQDPRAAAVRDRMRLIESRTDGRYAFETIKKDEPKYSAMVRDTASAAKMSADDLEVVWRAASAAAHGKNWFQHVAYTMQVGEEYEPGYFRVALQPDPDEITRFVTAAADMTSYGVLRFITRAGHHPDSLYPQAFARLIAATATKATR